MHLFDLILCLPASSAIHERGFSVMKIVKTDYRNRLRAASMTNVMVVKMHSAETGDFEPANAANLWYAQSKRLHKPEYKASATSLLPNPSTEEELVTALEEEQVTGESMAITAIDVDSDSLR